MVWGYWKDEYVLVCYLEISFNIMLLLLLLLCKPLVLPIGEKGTRRAIVSGCSPCLPTYSYSSQRACSWKPSLDSQANNNKKHWGALYMDLGHGPLCLYGTNQKKKSRLQKGRVR